jgi:hypothetical protein
MYLSYSQMYCTYFSFAKPVISSIQMDRGPFRETIYIEDPIVFSKFRGSFRGRCWREYRTTSSSKFRVHDPLEVTSTEKLYSGGRKPIYSGVFRNRQC